MCAVLESADESPISRPKTKQTIPNTKLLHNNKNKPGRGKEDDSWGEMYKYRVEFV